MDEQERQEAKALFLASAKVAEKAELLGVSLMKNRSDLLCVLKDAAMQFKWDSESMSAFLDVDEETFKHDVIGFQKHCPNTKEQGDSWDCFSPRFSPSNDRRYYNKGVKGHDGSNTGRRPLEVPRRTYSIRCTEKEIVLVRKHLKDMRERSVPMTIEKLTNNTVSEILSMNGIKDVHADRLESALNKAVLFTIQAIKNGINEPKYIEPIKAVLEDDDGRHNIQTMKRALETVDMPSFTQRLKKELLYSLLDRTEDDPARINEWIHQYSWC